MKSYQQFVESLSEKLSKSDDISKWISDFVNSGDPKFAGKSKDERIKMAKGAYYGAQNEEVELDEAAYLVVHHGHDNPDYKMPKGRQVLNHSTKYENSAIRAANNLKSKGFHDVQITKDGKKFDQTNETFQLGEDADFIQQHLANKDINSSVEGKIVKVHSSDVAAAKKHLAKIGYKDHKVVSGLNEETDEQKKAKDELDLKLKKWRNQQRASKALQNEETSDDAHFKKQSKAMQDAINLHLRRGNSYKDAVDLAKKHVKEETEQIDELSKDTLTSYVGKSFAAGNELHKQIKDGAGDKQALRDKISKRNQGVITAVKKLKKEENEMLTYSQFMEKLAESRIDDLRDKQAAEREAKKDSYEAGEKEKSSAAKRTIKGHSYGAGEDGDEDDDEKKKPSEPAVKRGRGRPAGSKSGARV